MVDGEANGNGDGNVETEIATPMDQDQDPRVDPTASGSSMQVDQNDGGKERSKKVVIEKKYFMGEDGVNVWRKGMQVGNFMMDGISESFLSSESCHHYKLTQQSSLTSSFTSSFDKSPIPLHFLTIFHTSFTPVYLSILPNIHSWSPNQLGTHNRLERWSPRFVLREKEFPGFISLLVRY